MSDERPSRTYIRGDIRNNQGNAAVGQEINQSQTRIDLSAAPTAEELQELANAFSDLKAKVERESPPEVRNQAVERVEELEQATTAPEPDVTAMARARSWFLKHAPGLLGAVTSVLVNPIVGKIVSSAGDAIADEYKRRFPEAADEA
jgi:hypothetical protein